MFGGKAVEVVLSAIRSTSRTAPPWRPASARARPSSCPSTTPRIIEGQGTVGLEILQQSRAAVDYIFVPIGGGGLASGIGSVYKQMSPQTKIIGVEPAGARRMKLPIERGEVTGVGPRRQSWSTAPPCSASATLRSTYAGRYSTG